MLSLISLVEEESLVVLVGGFKFIRLDTVGRMQLKQSLATDRHGGRAELPGIGDDGRVVIPPGK